MTIGVVELGNDDQDKLRRNSSAAGAAFSSVAAAAPSIKDRTESSGRTELGGGGGAAQETAVGASNTSPCSAAAADSEAGVRGCPRQKPRISPAGILDPSDPQVKLRAEEFLSAWQLVLSIPAYSLATRARCDQIKQDVLAMMVQYLRSEKLFMSAVVIQDEANMKTTEQQARRAQGNRLRKATLEGDWSMVGSLITKNLSRQHHKRFLYAAYRQEYLELIERQEFQKAFAFLNRRLKPMEATAASTPNEFLNLCYLLTCKSVADASHFRNWGGVLGGRERLADELARVVEVEAGSLAPPAEMPPNRLVTLLQQAVAFQIERGRYHPKVIPQASTLARDYRCPAVPNTPRDVYEGHTAGVKCLTFVGEQAALIASGAANGIIHLWPTNPYLDDEGDDDDSDDFDREGNNGCGGGWSWGDGERIDGSRDRDRGEVRGQRLGQRQQQHLRHQHLKQEGEEEQPERDGGAPFGGSEEGGGDAGAGGGAGGFLETGWKRDQKGSQIETGGRTVSPLLSLRAGGVDEVRIWDVASNRAGSLLASASGDGAVRLWTLPPSDQVLSEGSGALPEKQPRAVLRGHGDGLGSSGPDVYSVEFHAAQGHVVTAGHDRTVRLYDIESGQETKVFAGHEAGVLHAIGNPCGNLLVSGGRDSSIMFWDVMSGVCVKTLSQAVGAVTSVDLTMDGMYLVASSRHGPVRTWDVRMGQPLLRYKGHQNTSSSFLRATLGAGEGLVFGGSDNSNLYVWHRRGTQLLHALTGHTDTVYRGTWSANQGVVATCSEDGTVRTWWSRSL